ncbi:MAG: MarR family winged helix-turn-helix transcriptional regulator [Clostridiaceae bacterium]|nr:MarR family winged helix-turn-helix transcriptional regulator [Clostridiaceae bacterium]
MDSPDVNMVTDILDALEIAKKAYALLPQMPSNMKSVHFRVLGAIYRTRDDTGGTRVSDINRSLGFRLPNTIRFINELVELNAVVKLTPASDKRVVLVRATELGEQYINNYVLKYQKLLEKEFSVLGESNRKTMIETINKVYKAMKKVYLDN